MNDYATYKFNFHSSVSLNDLNKNKSASNVKFFLLGVSDVDEVVRRFETQEETANHLQELQARAEKEIRDLGVVKEKLEAEWELVKFMGQEENTELR